MEIPILIICHNNYIYVKHTMSQIKNINELYYNNIVIVNNDSTCLNTINFLKNVDVKVINNVNDGPWICDICNMHIYDILPNKYILTDPDLKFNANIPSNFIEILSELSDKYKTSKIGFALDISDFDKMYQGNYVRSLNIYDFEKMYWENKINDINYEMYNSPIDTTFCLINKNYISEEYDLRIAGNFTAKHMPWYKCNELFNTYELYLLNTKTSSDISTTSNMIISYINNTYLKINKNNELFFIENNINNHNLSFWKDHYSNWENETFEIFDRHLSQDKIFIDIGGWIGPTSLYGSRKSKHVYSIEAENKCLQDMNCNLQTNRINNYTLINKAIYNIDNIKIKFGKNKFLDNSKMHDSTAQIYEENDISDEFYLVDTITIESIILNYDINPAEIGLIKVDIAGGEENILNDLISIHTKYNIPLYVSFHYTWWNDKNLDRFNLSSEIKDRIRTFPFDTILFN